MPDRPVSISQNDLEMALFQIRGLRANNVEAQIPNGCPGWLGRIKFGNLRINFGPPPAIDANLESNLNYVIFKCKGPKKDSIVCGGCLIKHGAKYSIGK